MSHEVPRYGSQNISICRMKHHHTCQEISRYAYLTKYLDMSHEISPYLSRDVSIFVRRYVEMPQEITRCLSRDINMSNEIS